MIILAFCRTKESNVLSAKRVYRNIVSDVLEEVGSEEDVYYITDVIDGVVSENKILDPKDLFSVIRGEDERLLYSSLVVSQVEALIKKTKEDIKFYTDADWYANNLDIMKSLVHVSENRFYLYGYGEKLEKDKIFLSLGYLTDNLLSI